MKRKRREKRGRSSRQPVEKNRNHRASVIFWTPAKQIRRNIQTSEIVGSLKLIRAVHRVEWTWHFGKIEK